MNFTGIDWHKRYSVCYTVDGSGKKLKEQKIEGNSPQGFARYFGSLT